VKIVDKTMPAPTVTGSPTVPRRGISRSLTADDDPLAADPVIADGVILEYLKTNRNTDEYLERLGEGGRLKDLPEFSRTLNILPEGPRTKDLLEDRARTKIADDDSIRRLRTTNLFLG